jgi:hypothetical protein
MARDKKWNDKLEKCIKFMDNENKRPKKESSDENEKSLGKWLSYQFRQGTIRNEYREKLWNEFINNSKYSKYFITKKEKKKPLTRKIGFEQDPLKQMILDYLDKNKEFKLLKIICEDEKEYNILDLPYCKRDDKCKFICKCNNIDTRDIRSIIKLERGMYCNDCILKNTLKTQNKQRWTEKSIYIYFARYILLWNVANMSLNNNYEWKIPIYEWWRIYHNGFTSALIRLKFKWQDLLDRYGKKYKRNKNELKDVNKLNEEIKKIYEKVGIEGLIPEKMDKNYTGIYNTYIRQYEITDDDNYSSFHGRNGFPSLYCCNVLNIEDKRKEYIIKNFPSQCNFDELIEYHFKPILELYGTLPLQQWFLKNNVCGPIMRQFKLKTSWKEIKQALNIKNDKHISCDGSSWDSGGEVSLANFLIHRNIQIKKGNKYPDDFDIIYGGKNNCTYDMKIYSPIQKKWIIIELWGIKLTDTKTFMDGYLERRKVKEKYWKDKDNFIGIEWTDSLNINKLIDIFEPYIGLIEPDKKYIKNNDVELLISETLDKELIRRTMDIYNKYPNERITYDFINEKDPGLSPLISKYRGGLVSFRRRLNISKPDNLYHYEINNIIDGLLYYKNTNSTKYIDIPHDYIISDECQNKELHNMKLGVITGTIRNNFSYLKGDFKNNIQKLLNINFVFCNNEYHWNLLYSGLIYFKSLYGNIDVPSKYKLPVNILVPELSEYPLGMKVSCIRSSQNFIKEMYISEDTYKKYIDNGIKITKPKERKEMLDRLGFIYEIRSSHANLNHVNKRKKDFLNSVNIIVKYYNEYKCFPEKKNELYIHYTRLKNIVQVKYSLTEERKNIVKLVEELMCEKINPFWKNSYDVSKIILVEDLIQYIIKYKRLPRDLHSKKNKSEKEIIENKQRSKLQLLKKQIKRNEIDEKLIKYINKISEKNKILNNYLFL